MESGLSFFKSTLARRIILLFIICAFVPMILLILFSYWQVVNQLEEQSDLRLQREVKSYGLSLYDRMIRIEYELRGVGRFLETTRDDFQFFLEDHGEELEHLFHGLGVYSGGEAVSLMYGKLGVESLIDDLTPERLAHPKPFVFFKRTREPIARFFFCVNLGSLSGKPYTVIGEVKATFLFGFGVVPLVPPMSELTVFSKSGANIFSTGEGPRGTWEELKQQMKSVSPRIFRYRHAGKAYHAGVSSLFIESRFQSGTWTILLSRAGEDIMSSIDHFKRTFPFIILFFLVLIVYLCLFFIRRGMEPLTKLKKGTQRLAQRDFSQMVEVNSGDEFEDLSTSFNSMALMLRKQFDTMEVLGEMDRAILSSLNMQKTISTTLLRVKNYFHCSSTHYLKTAGSLGPRAKVYSLLGRRIADPVIHYHALEGGDQKLFIDDIQILSADDELPPVLRKLDSSDNRLIYLCIPICLGGQVERFLLLCKPFQDEFNEDEISQANKIANQLAIGLSNSILVDKLEGLAKGTVEALARTVDAKSRWTSGHSERVAEISGRIGREMGLESDEIESLVRAGLLHDIGKIGIPVSILDKPSRLSHEEYAKIQEHPSIGGEILEPILVYQDIIPVVEQHHERFDGTGYPSGLAGEDIDLRARIMAVADVWDALVSERPYRGGWVSERAKNLIIEKSGTDFDPKVVDAFLVITEEE